ncbi:MAG: glycosyltransferase family 9 protein, partial [Limisphaerales bacterium]
RSLGPRAVSTDGTASWAELAGLLWRARLFVGVDTAAMHLAAACQCPTVAIFGPSVVGFWRPWRVAHEVVVAGPRPDFPASHDEAEALKRRRTDEVPLEGVLAACDRMLAPADAPRLSAAPAQPPVSSS